MVPTSLKALCLLFIAFGLISCGTKEKTVGSADAEIYEFARKANDFPTAINAAYRLIYADSSNYQYYDSIAYLYQMLGNSKGAFEISEEGLKKHQSLLLKQISAHATMDLGQYTDAVIKYQELIKLDPDNTVKYQYAVGEGFFMLGNYVSSLEYMGQVVDNEKSAMLDMELQSGKSVQKVPYKLAAINSIGFALLQMEKYEEAEKVYLDLLAQKADFELAKNNYALLKELKKQQK